MLRRGTLRIDTNIVSIGDGNQGSGNSNIRGSGNIATNVVSLGSMMNNANQSAALFYHLWWWFIPPGVVLTGMVAALLIANVGLDEVFNPKLREQ